MYSEPTKHGAEEEDDVPLHRVLVRSPLSKQHVTMLLNSAKCNMMLHQTVVDKTQYPLQAVIAQCSAVRSLGAHYMQSERGEEQLVLRKLCVSAVQLRGKANLAAGHIRAAQRDSSILSKAAAGEAQAAAAAARFAQECAKAEKLQLKSDRKLAKEVGAWVETSLKRSEQVANANAASSSSATNRSSKARASSVASSSDDDSNGDDVNDSDNDSADSSGAGNDDANCGLS
jgi:hypothetical protein